MNESALTPGSRGQGHYVWLSGEASAGGLGALWLVESGSSTRPVSGWLGPGGADGLVAPGSQGASALWLWGLCPGASSAVFWVDAWLSLRWASWVLCSVGAAGGLGLVALSACF